MAITKENFVLYPETAVWFAGKKIQQSPKFSLVSAAQQHHEPWHNVMTMGACGPSAVWNILNDQKAVKMQY